MLFAFTLISGTTVKLTIKEIIRIDRSENSVNIILPESSHGGSVSRYNAITVNNNDLKFTIKDLSPLLCKNRINPILTSCFDLYTEADQKRDEALGYLYKILETIKSDFNGNECDCRKALEIGKKGIWDAISKPVNDKFIKQSRHAGDPTQAEDISEDVLENAFGAARQIILAYIRYLDKKCS